MCCQTHQTWSEGLREVAGVILIYWSSKACQVFQEEDYEIPIKDLAWFLLWKEDLGQKTLWYVKK